MDHISGHRLSDFAESDFAPIPAWAGQDEFAADEVARIGAHVRTLVTASKDIHEAARGRCSATPGRQIVQTLCEAILADMAALADEDGAHPGALDATVALQEEERELRLGRLLIDGKALADDCRAGAFDDPAHGPARLAAHARRLGDRYVQLLQRVAPLR